MRRTILILSIVATAFAGISCSHEQPPPAGVAEMQGGEAPGGEQARRALAIVNAHDRTDADRQLDESRRPVQLLEYLQVEPGMNVAELMAGAGYTAELLARAVAPGGVLYAENPRFVLATTNKAWTQRLERPAMKGVVRVDRELYDPLPPQAKDLDLVVLSLNYHDTVYLGVDRDAMNKAVLRALKPGGRYVVIDNSARPGRGLADVETLHRIDEQTVIQEVERAGFKLAAHGDFLRNPADKRDWSTAPQAVGKRRGEIDRFVLTFVKP